jgi:hypothetical protein
MAIELASAMAACLMLHCKNSTKGHLKFGLSNEQTLEELEGALQTLT